MSDDDNNYEKLTEKHTQTQSAIKNLQQIEETMHKNLKQAKVSQNPAGEQQELLGHIGKLSAIRENLFKDLKLEYDEALAKQGGAASTAGTQSAMINNTEKRLNKMKGDLGNAEEVRENRKRMIQIGDYEFSRYEKHKSLMKIIAFTALGIIISVFLLKKQIVPQTLAKAGIVASGAIGLIFLVYQVVDMWYRNNMDYNKYNFGVLNSPGPPDSWPEAQESVWEVNKKGASRIFWGDRGTESEQDDAKADLAQITGGIGDVASMKEEGAALPDNYEQQLQKLFNEKNCPEGAFIRGYCEQGGAGKEGGGGGGASAAADGGAAAAGGKARDSVVGNASVWKGLEFDKEASSGPGPWEKKEGFKLLGCGAGAGPNPSGKVVSIMTDSI
jgi:hypothetical protein